MSLVLILLVVIVGLVFFVRSLLVRLQKQIRRQTTTAGADEEAAERGARDGSIVDAIDGRELKARFLRGEISRAEFDERIRKMQIEQYLEGSK